MSPRFPSSRRSTEGFTLVEVMVAMTLLVTVVVMSIAVLFLMKRFTDRQQFFVEPRQKARRACDYLSFYVRGATDMNASSNNANAIVAWYNQATTLTQASYNNLTAAQSTAGYGDPNTDIVTLAVPQSNLFVPVINWPGWQHSATLQFNYGAGCPNSALNLQMFKDLTGAHINAQGKEVSNVLMLIGDNGTWGYYQITDYQDQVNANNCTNPASNTPPPAIDVQNNPGLSDQVNPPGGQPELQNPKLASVQFTSFRIKTVNGVPQLQQRWGVFNPTSPDAGFNDLMDGVVDLQVAWIYSDGTVWDTAAPNSELPTTGNVPTQNISTPGPYDVSKIVGLRISLVARSGDIPTMIMYTAKPHRPQAEDHAGAGTGEEDRRYYYRMTATQMIRNRMLGD